MMRVNLIVTSYCLSNTCNDKKNMHVLFLLIGLLAQDRGGVLDEVEPLFNYYISR